MYTSMDYINVCFYLRMHQTTGFVESFVMLTLHILGIVGELNFLPSKVRRTANIDVFSEEHTILYICLQEKINSKKLIAI